MKHAVGQMHIKVFTYTQTHKNCSTTKSSNFDAQAAETTINMTACLLLTLRIRYDNYESKGALYRFMNADVLGETLDRRP